MPDIHAEVANGIAHCVHHDVHFEYCYNLEERRRYIDRDKPESERAVRQANLWLFPLETIPPDLQKANADSRKAYADLHKTRADSRKAYPELQKAWADSQLANADWQKAAAEWQPALIVIHDRLVAQGYVCTWNGRSILEPKGAI